MSKNRLARFPEQHPAFQVPATYLEGDNQRATAHQPVVPYTSAEHDATVIVTWYSDDDPDNPYNWSSGKKLWVGGLLLVYTLAVYIGASLYTASEAGISMAYNVGDEVSSVGLALYVIAYGVGPMLFSPLSEIPSVGRNIIYLMTFAVFTILCVPMALAQSFVGILVLRFLMGFFGSPCLATAGASYGDFYGAAELPYVIALWGGGATLGPALGPLVGNFAVQAESWRWTSWELLWFCGPVAILMFISLPETSADTILLRRARRLRKLTERSNLQSESELRQAALRKSGAREIAFFALIKPWEINALDPAVLFTTFYTGLTYGIYYSFFESFPLVYQDMYGFNPGQLGLAFLSVLVGLVVAVALLCGYLYFGAEAYLARFDPVPPEARILPGLFATFLIPVGLYIFAWTARPLISEFVSLAGVAISMCGVFIITQAIFVYLPFTYPRYAGSLFAANGLARSLLASAAILFSGPMFAGIHVSGGVTVLASLSVLCILGMFLLFFFGAALRQRSRFAIDT